MNFFDKNHTVTEIVAVVDVHGDNGPETVHNNRPSHGIAFFYGKGSIYNFSDGTHIETDTGDIIYLPKGSWYTVAAQRECPSETACYAINFQVNDDGIYKPLKLKIKAPQVLALYKSIFKIRRTPSPTAHEECLSDLYKLLVLITKEYLSDYSPTNKKSILEPAVNYIHEHCIYEDISAEHLSKICKISQSYMRKLFNSVYGQSPIEYMRSVRIEYAKELLTSGEYSVTQAASLSGFNDAAYFSREFKKYFSVAPSKYAK
jgi:AraC-like DNA-binding protein